MQKITYTKIDIIKKVSKNDRFRLSVSRSIKNISAQIIDDNKNITLLSASSNEKDIKSLKKINKTIIKNNFSIIKSDINKYFAYYLTPMCLTHYYNIENNKQKTLVAYLHSLQFLSGDCYRQNYNLARLDRFFPLILDCLCC